MNISNILRIVFLTMLSVFLFSCSKSDKKDSILEIKVQPDESEVSFLVLINEPIYVNWGDGNIIEIRPEPSEGSLYTEVKHKYYNPAAEIQTIIIEGDNLIEFIIKGRTILPSMEFLYLSFDGFSKLKLIDCMNLGLEKLSFKNCESLETVICNNNKLKTLNLDNCKSLKTLECSNNELTSLNFTKTKNITALACAFNPLQTINIANSPKLQYLFCDNTDLTLLDVSGCDDLFYIECYDNKFDKNSINSLLSSLPKIKNNVQAYLKINLVEGADVKIAKDKGWNIEDWNIVRTDVLFRTRVFNIDNY